MNRAGNSTKAIRPLRPAGSSLPQLMPCIWGDLTSFDLWAAKPRFNGCPSTQKWVVGESVQTATTYLIDILLKT